MRPEGNCAGVSTGPERVPLAPLLLRRGDRCESNDRQEQHMVFIGGRQE